MNSFESSPGIAGIFVGVAALSAALDDGFCGAAPCRSSKTIAPGLLLFLSFLNFMHCRGNLVRAPTLGVFAGTDYA